MTAFGITGHQNLSSLVLAPIREGIGRALDRGLGSLVGVTSLAGGADQLFAEEVLLRGGQLHVVVPSEQYESSFARPDDLVSYRRLLSSAEVVETLERAQPDEKAYLAAGQRVVELADVLIAVWDGQPARGLGGTADIVEHAHRSGKQVVVVWPVGVLR